MKSYKIWYDPVEEKHYLKFDGENKIEEYAVFNKKMDSDRFITYSVEIEVIKNEEKNR